MKLLVNNYEKITYDRLATACQSDGAIVCPKVRLKDALPIKGKRLSGDHFRFALQSHFDFVVVDQASTVLFAVEFDGASHNSDDARRRDAIKNELCDRFQLPLLRVNANHLRRKFCQWDLLSYFIETWFLKRAFYEAQEKGMIPFEEDFDPMMIVADGSGKQWPYWFSAPSQIRIQRLQKAGTIAHLAPSHLIGLDSAGNYRCLAYLKISTDAYAVIRTGMRAQLFDACGSEVLWQVGVVELAENLDEILAGRTAVHRLSQVELLIQRFQQDYQICSSGGIVEPPLRREPFEI